ncbi:MAG: hypothetical protein KGZ49_00185 [Syntrophaceae bacterium]|nr:hypothetical protein [Syntrophaceae bacterium]
MEENKAKIGCPTFQKQELLIKYVTEGVNMAKNVQEKAEFYQRINEEVDVLLRCQDYDEARFDCKNCYFISNLRKKTSNLIIRAKILGRY